MPTRALPGAIALAALLAAPLAAQSSLLRSGPMVGYSEMREVLLWVQTTAAARVQFVYWDSAAPGIRQRTREVTTHADSAFTARLVAAPLEPGRRYQYELLINGRAVPRPYPLRFQAQALWQWRTDPPAFRFALASCFYVNEARYDRPGEPYGGDFQVLGPLTRAAPDFMLWLGDNTYLREPDWGSRTGILHRYSHTRAFPALQPLLGATHHYALWDDHEYGPNDSDRSFRGKDLAREAFTLFWGNQAYGVDGLGGITSRFEWADAEFFLLDDRWHRSANRRRGGERQMLGRAQIEWLVDALASSTAAFKFVAMGGQILNPAARYETMATFPEERAVLLERLAQAGVPGVILLSGDRHHTELTKLEVAGAPPLYELTVSPLTAGVSRAGTDEPNTLRVPETLVQARNFALLEVSGTRRDRQLVIRIVDAEGAERWTRTLRASELR